MKIKYSNSIKKKLLLMLLSASTSLGAMDAPTVDKNLPAGQEEQQLASENFSTRNPSQEFIGNYGLNAHKKFQRMTPQIIEEVIQFLQNETRRSSTLDIKDLINIVGEKRADVARNVGSKNEIKFGKSRRLEDGYRGCGDFTSLYVNTYPHWRAQLANHLTPILEEMSNEGLAIKEISYPASKLLISINPFSFYDLPKSDKVKYQTNPTSAQFQKLADHVAIFDKTMLYVEADACGSMPKAQRKALEMVNQWDSAYVIKASFHLKMGDRFIPTSSVFMRYLKDNTSSHPQGLSLAIVGNLMREGAMIYQHTLQIHLPTIEAALGQYYGLILKWQPDNKKSPERNERSLLALLGGFHYLFDHLMPYERGSGAGAEWATQALGAFKGI